MCAMPRSLRVLFCAGCLGLVGMTPGLGGEAPAKTSTQPGSPDAAPAAKTTPDEQTLKAVNVKTDGESLLGFFRKRTLTADDRAKAEELIRQLGATAFRVREQATADLIARG